MNKDNYNNLYSYYDDLLNKLNSEFDASSIFSDDNSKKFISQMVGDANNEKSVKKCINLITDYRAKHTISAYLLGMLIKEKLTIDTKKWRRLPGENSAKGSFNLFWTWVCLFHDIGYYYEMNRGNKYSHIASIDEFKLELNIQYDLLEYSQNASLIRNYFVYIKEVRHKLDHGIIGAILLYDSLMRLANNDRTKVKYSKIKEYSKFFVKICDVIALHNMWRATDDTKELYVQYSLQQLIPSIDNSHMVFYSNNSLLYLLALVDTLDPVKYFKRDGRSRIVIDEISILSSYSIEFKNRKEKILKLKSSLDEFTNYCDSIASLDFGIQTWMNLETEFMNDELKITLKTS